MPVWSIDCEMTCMSRSDSAIYELKVHSHLPDIQRKEYPVEDILPRVIVAYIAVGETHRKHMSPVENLIHQKAGHAPFMTHAHHLVGVGFQERKPSSTCVVLISATPFWYLDRRWFGRELPRRVFSILGDLEGVAQGTYTCIS